MKKIDSIPNKGEYFIYKIDKLNKFVFDSENGYKLLNKKIDEDTLKNKYIVFLYLGNGLAREYYTSIIFNVIDDVNYNCNDYLDFLKKFEKALRHPLSISINEDTNLYSVDKNFQKKLKNYNVDPKKIKLTIKSLENQAKKELLDEINYTIEKEVGDYYVKKL